MARSVDAGVDSDQGPGRSLQWVTRSDSIVQQIVKVAVKVEEVAVQVQASDHYYVTSLDFVLFQLLGRSSSTIQFIIHARRFMSCLMPFVAAAWIFSALRDPYDQLYDPYVQQSVDEFHIPLGI